MDKKAHMSLNELLQTVETITKITSALGHMREHPLNELAFPDGVITEKECPHVFQAIALQMAEDREALLRKLLLVDLSSLTALPEEFRITVQAVKCGKGNKSDAALETFSYSGDDTVYIAPNSSTSREDFRAIQASDLDRERPGYCMVVRFPVDSTPVFYRVETILKEPKLLCLVKS